MDYHQAQQQRPPFPLAVLFIIIGLLIFLGAGGLYLYGMYVESQIADEPVITTPSQVTPKETKEIDAGVGLKIPFNAFVTDTKTPIPVLPEFVVGDDVFVYTYVEGFDQELKNGRYYPNLSYGVQVIDPNGEIVEGLLRPELTTSQLSSADKFENYYFTARLGTGGLETGEYKLNVRVRDKISRQESVYVKNFTLIDADSITIIALRLVDALDQRASEFASGNVLRLRFGLTGPYQGKTLNADIDLKLYNKEGELMPDWADYTFLDVNEQLLGQSLAIEGRFDSTGLSTGEYSVEIVAIDKTTGDRDTASIPLVII